MSRAKTSRPVPEAGLLAQAGWVRDDAATAWRCAADGRCSDALRNLDAAQAHLGHMRARVLVLAAEGRRVAGPPVDLRGLLAFLGEGDQP